MNARPELSFDGCGINGPDEYRTRVATFRSEAEAKKYGPLFEVAPDALTALHAAVGVVDSLTHQIEQMRGMFSDGDGTIALALADAEEFEKQARGVLARVETK